MGGKGKGRPNEPEERTELPPMADPQTLAMLPASGTPSEERLLVEHLRRMESSRDDTYAAHVHLSELKSANRKPQFIRVAARSFEALVAGYEAGLYTLANADLVLVCRNVPTADIESAIFKLRALFAEDPLSSNFSSAAKDRFVTWYDLSEDDDYNALLSVADVMASRRARESQEPAPASNQQAMTGMPLNPKNLSAINLKLKEARISDLIHHQPVVQIRGGGKGELLFEEYYVSMAGLQKRIAPDVNLFASPWLFQFLTETLDQRVLSVLARLDLAGKKSAISLNLNISTILDGYFQKFHEAVGDHAAKVIIELQLINVFSDMGAFTYVRDQLQERGYRVLIDGLNPLSLQFFDPALLKGDLVKIAWAPEFLGRGDGRAVDVMRAAVSEIGKDRVILARVDSEDAVRWGLNLGIGQFQGHFVDRIAAAMAAKGSL